MPVLVNYVDRGLSKGRGMVQLNLIQATVCGWKKRSQNCLNSEYLRRFLLLLLLLLLYKIIQNFIHRFKKIDYLQIQEYEIIIIRI